MNPSPFDIRPGDIIFLENISPSVIVKDESGVYYTPSDEAKARFVNTVCGLMYEARVINKNRITFFPFLHDHVKVITLYKDSIVFSYVHQEGRS